MARRGENIYKRKDGRWEGRYIKGYDICGKPMWKSIYGKSYAEVKERLAYMKVAVKNDKEVISSNITVTKWFEIWLAQKGQIKESTLMVYKSRLKNHITPLIGAIKLKELNKEILQRFIDDLSKKYKPTTVRAVYALLRTAFETAEEKNLISGFYQHIKLPKLHKSNVRAMSFDEQKALEKAVIESKNQNDIGIIICLYTGIRIGELCALKWENIDLNKGCISIRETIQRVEGIDKKTRIVFTPPKSLASQRDIPISPFLIDILKKVQKETGFVINRNGKYIEPRTYTRRFKKLTEIAGIQDITFHCTRHTFATRALEIGMDIKTLSEILGHSNAGVTLHLYAHSLEEHKKKEMERLGELFYVPSK